MSTYTHTHTVILKCTWVHFSSPMHRPSSRTNQTKPLPRARVTSMRSAASDEREEHPAERRVLRHGNPSGVRWVVRTLGGGSDLREHTRSSRGARPRAPATRCRQASAPWLAGGGSSELELHPTPRA
jgi:hypothetical protein